MPAAFTMGAQSYSFRKFNLQHSITCLKNLGLDAMEFCGAHFPADATHREFANVKAALEAARVKVPCYGVEGFSADAAANRNKFEFAKALGIGVLTADPSPDSFENLDALCAEFGVKIAIHNHGPKARYDKVDDTLKAVQDHSASIGACVDTGHSIRSGEKPHEVIKVLGSRVISLHLKDWKLGGPEKIIGEGDMDLVAVARELKAINFAGPIMMEYEESPENPVPDMRKGLENWRRAVEQA
ncbi:MAG: sugar phosphate isomerase/epimerase [Candidatus Hydrogenedentes bacterium]|nr:sugar phosphate isomerase/epimerase [Candidatus Hydrogenedentota bacterium]